MNRGNVAWMSLALSASMAVAQTPIIESAIVSTGARQFLDGTSAGLAVNEPGSVWIWGGGWHWGSPYIPATWDPPGMPVDIVNLVEERTVLALSITDQGGYVKPARIRVEASMLWGVDRNNTGGVGFYSEVPARDDSQNPFEHFTGLHVDENAGTFQVREDGVLVGSPVSVGAIEEGVFYVIGCEVDTSTGALLTVTLDGEPVEGLSSTAFTDAATAYAGVAVGGNSRAWMNSLRVLAVSPPPPQGTLITFQ